MAKTRTGKKSIVSSSKKTEKSILWQVSFWCLAVLLFLPPFFRGLFFATEQRKALLFSLIIFGMVCLWKWIRKEYTVLSHPMDYFMLGLPVVYIISAFNSVNSGLAVDEIVKVILYFTVYWTVAQLVRNKKDAEMLIYIIYGSAILVALSGLMTATGLTNIKDGFSDGRLAASFQYANALASYTAAVFVLGTYLWWNFTHQKNEGHGYKTGVHRYISFPIAVANCLLLAVLIGAKSNGGFIIFGLGILMLLAFLPGMNRFLILIHLSIVTVPAAGSIYFFLENVKNKQFVQAWLWVLGAAILAAGLQWLYLKIVIDSLQNENIRRGLLIGGGILIVIMSFIVSFTLADEIKSLTGKFKADSLAHRIYFVEDAIKMFKERPVFGWGGGGWQEAYRYFQSYSYTSTQVHSHYVQVAVEAGIAGLLAIASLWVAFLLALSRAYRKKDRIFATFLGVSVLIFGIHASIDFDLSLSALSMVLYTVMAIIRNMDKGIFEQQSEPEGKVTKGRISLAINASIGLIILILLIPILSAQYYYNEAMSFYEEKNVDKTLIYMQKAALYDPFHTEYHVALSDVYRLTGKLDRAKDEMNNALLRSKYNPDIRTRLANITLQQGDYQGAVKYADEAIAMAPWQIAYYEFAGNVYKSVGIMDMKINRHQGSNAYFDKLAKIPLDIKAKMSTISQTKQKLSESFIVTPGIALSVGVSFIVQNKLEAASSFFTYALNDERLKGEAYVWLSIVSNKMGSSKAANEYFKEAKKQSDQTEKLYQDLSSVFL